MTQEALAEKVNCSVDTIKRIEVGKVARFDVLYFVSEVLDVPFYSFFPPREKDTNDYIREMHALLDAIEENLS